MRLHARTLKEVRIAPRLEAGSREAFSEETVSYRGAVLPGGGNFTYTLGGVADGEELLLILPGAAAVSVGDGAWVDGRLYVAQRVERWPWQVEVVVAARD